MNFIPKKIQSINSNTHSSKIITETPKKKNSSIDSKSYAQIVDFQSMKIDPEANSFLIKQKSKKDIQNENFIIEKSGLIRNYSQNNKDKTDLTIFNKQDSKKNKKESNPIMINNKEGEDLSFKEKYSNKSFNSKSNEFSENKKTKLNKKQTKRIKKKEKKEIKKKSVALLSNKKPVKENTPLIDPQENSEFSFNTKGLYTDSNNKIVDSKILVKLNKEDQNPNKIIIKKSTDMINNMTFENFPNQEKTIQSETNKINEFSKNDPFIEKSIVVNEHKTFMEIPDINVEGSLFQNKLNKEPENNDLKLEPPEVLIPKIFVEYTNDKEDNNTYPTNLGSEGDKFSVNSVEEFDFDKAGFN